MEDTFHPASAIVLRRRVLPPRRAGRQGGGRPRARTREERGFPRPPGLAGLTHPGARLRASPRRPRCPTESGRRPHPRAEFSELGAERAKEQMYPQGESAPASAKVERQEGRRTLGNRRGAGGGERRSGSRLGVRGRLRPRDPLQRGRTPRRPSLPGGSQHRPGRREAEGAEAAPPRPGPGSAQLPEPPSALPPAPEPCPPRGGGRTNLRGHRHGPGRKPEPRAPGRRAESGGKLRLPGRGLAGHAAAAAGLPPPGARGARARPPLAGTPGRARGPSPGAAPGRPRARPAPATSAPPLPLGRGAGDEVPAVTSRSCAASRGFPAGVAYLGHLDSRVGRRWPGAGTLAREPQGRRWQPGLQVSFCSTRAQCP